MAKGIIYIMTTAVTGLIKIGKTRSDQFENRMRLLEQNGYWNVTGLKRYFAMEVEQYDEKEKMLHIIFSKSQVANSELFALDKDLVRHLLESFDGLQVYPPVAPIVIVPEPSPKPQQKVMQPAHKAPPLTFAMLNIPVGTVLTYVFDQSITVTTLDMKNMVKYHGQAMPISRAAQTIRNTQAEQGGYYFLWKGKRLTEWRKEIEAQENTEVCHD